MVPTFCSAIDRCWPVADPILVERFAAIGQTAGGSTPAEFAAAIEFRRSKMAEVVKLIGHKALN